MLARRLYYQVKPALPWGLRMAVRRLLAKRIRRFNADVWPILESAARKPEGWPGWPDGKQFALVLTHDVESPAGLAKVKPLAELEMKMGFRSSFNFVPEGAYSVPVALRSWLVDHGFEVGVHDLHHDGKLFTSRKVFDENARRINAYVKDWGAVGFRAGMMHHNLKWQHELEVLYTSTTFDIDPFEPQPDGVGTIFPFWVPRDRGQRTEDREQGAREVGRGGTGPFQPSPINSPSINSGYVELPYTLPQDSTLFLLLREQTNDIWVKKLDWIAGHGGMALVIVHPDYLCFDGETQSSRTYPLAHYAQFLEHARRQHGGAFLQASPKKLAGYVASLELPPRYRKRRRVGMVTHSFYESDNRVTRYAEALAGRGDEVDVLALRRNPEVPRHEVLQGVRVFRIQNRFGKTERGKFAYLWPILRFLASSMFWLVKSHSRRPYDLIHVHNVPDFLVLSAWYPKRAGARVILDIHDILPEFFASKFGVSHSHRTVRVLKWLERLSASSADHVILSNHLWLETYTARSAPASKCSVFINHVDAAIFRPRSRTRRDDKLLILFPGGLQWHQGLDIAIQAFAKALPRLPQAEFHIYGDGNMKEELRSLARQLGLDGKVRFFEPRSIRNIAEIMANADLGVVPKRADSFGNQAYSTKIMEFMSLGVPMVVSATQVDRYYFNDSVVRFFQSGNTDALAWAMQEVLTRPEARKAMVSRAFDYVRENSWEARKKDYLDLVDRLISRNGVDRRKRPPSAVLPGTREERTDEPQMTQMNAVRTEL